jgi:hydrogenase/urease accessory protein HupE
MFLLVAIAARAHDPGLSTGACRLDATNLEAVLTFSIIDIAEVVEVDANHDFRYSPEELRVAAAALETQAGGALEVSFDGVAVAASKIHFQFDENNNAMVMLSFAAPSCTNLVIRSKWLAVMPPGHRQFLSLQTSTGQVLSERLLSANNDSLVVQLNPTHAVATGHSGVKAIGDGASQAIASAVSAAAKISFTDFLAMGVRHIWTGYDHLLFLFGLLIVSRNFVSSIKIITCFTIAHSITLAVATSNLVQIPSRVVEPLIAASIIYVGVENLVRGGDPKGRWLLTFAFGLIHGFGFASVLRELGVGTHGSSIAVPLVSFNLGVEIGQIAIAAIALPVIWKLRSNPVFIRRWVPACSGAVALLGGYWFFERVFA